MVIAYSNGAGKRYYLHRFIYERFIASIKYEIMHTCDNRRCWNLAHLIDDTHKANMNDMARKGRAASGEFHGRSILTAEQVIKIRASGDTAQDLADEYGVGKTTIQHILNYRNWKHL